MTLNQKIEKEYFDRIAAGEKRDLRLAEDAVHKGDTMILEEWDYDTHEYTGRKVETAALRVGPVPWNGRGQYQPLWRGSLGTVRGLLSRQSEPWGFRRASL